MGLRTGQVAEATGYSLVRVSTLRGDPSFEELVASYRASVDEEWKTEITDYYGMVNKARDISARMILDQLVEADDAGEPVPLRTLANLHADLADRTGYGKRSTQVNVNLDFAAQLDRAIERSREVQVIEGFASPDPGPPASQAPQAPFSIEPPKQVKDEELT